MTEGEKLAGDELLELARQVDGETLEEKKPEPSAGPGLEAQAPAAPPPPVPLDQEIAGLFAMIGAGVSPFLPSVAAVLDERQCGELGRAIAPVMQKYGLERFFAGFQWRVELQALMVCVPVGIAIKQAIDHDLRAARARAKGEHEPAPASSSSSGAQSQAPDGMDTTGMLHPLEGAR